MPILPRLLDKLAPTALFARLTIASKMLLGYMTLVTLTVVVVVYALVSLQRINSLNRDIVMVDILMEEAADRMLDALLAQDTYEKRYLILKSRDMKNLFEKRGTEFSASIDALRNLPGSKDLPIETISTLHDRYSDLFSQEIRLIRGKNVDKAYAISNGELKDVLDKLLEFLRSLSSRAN